MDLRDILFRIRGVTPLPFLAAALYAAQFRTNQLIVGAVLCLLGELLRIRSVQYAGGATRTRIVGAPGLVSSGPYGAVRNPLYLANMLLYTGFALASGGWFPWLPLAAFVYFTFQYSMIISLEEETLKSRFGEEYAAYCRRVPRLFPFLRLPEVNQLPANRLLNVLREERSTLMGLGGSWGLLMVRLFLI